MTLNNQMNCDLFSSCKKTKYASQVSAMNNAIGFTTFQGTEAYRKTPIFINMDYTKEGGLSFDVDKCDTVPEDGKTLRGFPFSEECKCNTCQNACNYTVSSTLAVMYGFNVMLVVLVLVGVFIATLGIFFLKKCHKKKYPHLRSKSSSFATNLINHEINHNNKTDNNINYISNNI